MCICMSVCLYIIYPFLNKCSKIAYYTIHDKRYACDMHKYAVAMVTYDIIASRL